MNKKNIQHIISGSLKGVKSAEKALFISFAPKVLTICSRYSADSMEANDLLQECFIVVFKKLKNYDPQKGAFGGWLHRVCVNTILNILKKQERSAPIIFMENIYELQLQKQDLNQFDKTQLITTIQKLPVGYRQVLNLYIFEEWSHKEISNHLGITESASRSQLARAKATLKSLLSKKKEVQRHEKRLAK